VVKAQGLGGEVRLLPLTDDLDRFQTLDGCYVLSPGSNTGEFKRIERVRLQGGMPIIKLEGSDEIEAASQLVGRLLAVRDDAVVPLRQGSFYTWQVVGCRVVTEDGTEVGMVSDIEYGNGQDLWVVRHGEREHLIPAVAEIIVGVDPDAKKIVIRPPEGLLDL
jgi:16S rRNA processing protein RimM